MLRITYNCDRLAGVGGWVGKRWEHMEGSRNGQ